METVFDLSSTNENFLDETRESMRLNELSARLVSQDILPSLLEAVIDAAIDLTGAPMGNVQLVNPDGCTLRIVAQRGLGLPYLKYFAEVPSGFGTCGGSMASGRRMILQDVTKDPLYAGEVKEVLDHSNIKAVQSTPMISRDGRILGVFSTHWPNVHQPDKNTLRVLDLLSRMAANLIDHRQREEILRKAKDEAEELNRAKDLFLATLSHELRTPLTVILCWAQMLKHNKLSPEKAKLGLQCIEESALAQTQLINDLLDISKVMMGKITLEIEAIDIVEILQMSIDSVRPAGGKKLIQIIHHLPSTPLLISGDAARIRQIFWNLLSNAIKFTPKGGTIEVFLETKDDEVKIYIKDNGKGIKAEFLPHIFDRFSQADSSSVREHSGLGIGLALVYNFLKLHKGYVTAESLGENKGSTFTVTLPLLSSSCNDVCIENETLESDLNYNPLKGKKILFVDDEEKTREAIYEILSIHELDIRMANSVQEALALFLNFQPNIILTDIGMPFEDGYSLVSAIRSLGSDVPIIALTAYKDPENTEKLKMAGFNKWLFKPIDINFLIITLEQEI